MIISFSALLTIAICLPIFAPRCSMTQRCLNRDDPTTCSVPEKADYDPAVYTYSTPFVCPEFSGQPTCCNDDQNSLLANGFSLLDFTFGSQGGGCDVCKINFMRFWCHFTCSPRQAEFVTPGEQIKVVDPTDSSKSLLVLNVSMRITPDTACKLFQSCKKTAYVSQVSAMGTAEGLMNFVGTNAVVQGQEQINIEYTNEPSLKPLQLDLHDCSEKFWRNDSWGYKIEKNCSCNNCESSCDQTAERFIPQEGQQLQGFSWLPVVILYASCLALTVICIHVKG